MYLGYTQACVKLDAPANAEEEEEAIEEKGGHAKHEELPSHGE